MGRKLKLRKLAKPLAEARKDLKVDKAVLFVEDLFGGKLKSKPDILIVTDENRLEFLRLVRRCFPAKKFDLSFREAVKTPELRVSHIELEVECRNRKMLEETAVGRKKTGAITGGFLPGENLVVVKGRDNTSTIVHEMIHAEDEYYLDYECSTKTMMKILSIIQEGRAKFGEEVFLAGEDFNAERYFVDCEVSSPANFKIHYGHLIKTHGLLYTARMFLESIKNFNREEQEVYYAFKRVLAWLAHKLGDSQAAFRITTEKQPRTKEELKNFKEFYKKEIEEYQRTN